MPIRGNNRDQRSTTPARCAAAPTLATIMTERTRTALKRAAVSTREHEPLPERILL